MVKAASEDTLPVALDALRDKAREHLSGTQWIKLTRADDTLATDLAVIVHRNGYTVVAVNAKPDAVSLPPTYTEQVLSRPMA